MIFTFKRNDFLGGPREMRFRSMQPVTIRTSSDSLRVTARHSAPAPCDAFLDFDPILPGWPEERGDEGEQRDLDSTPAATPPDKSQIAESHRSPN